MTDFSSLSDEELYDQIVDEIETTMEINIDTLEIDVEDGFVTIWGSVSSINDSEALEKLLYKGLGLEDIDFNVVIDEGIQPPPEVLDERGRSHDDFDLAPGDSGFDDLTGSHRHI